METGVARIQIDLDEYREGLERYRGRSREIMRAVVNQAKANPKRIAVIDAMGEIAATQAKIQQTVAERLGVHFP